VVVGPDVVWVDVVVEVVVTVLVTVEEVIRPPDVFVVVLVTGGEV